jgi:amino acid transporter
MATVTATATRSRPRATAGKSGLRRDVGLTGLTFVSLGSIIGSGWLLGALTAAATAGGASLISWGLAGALLALLALVHAELGAAYPVSGGTARYPHYAFGSIAGYTCGWMSWLGSALLAPVEVEAALTYANDKVPGLTHLSAGSETATLTGLGILAASGLMLLFTIVNIIGVRRMAESNNIAVLWKLAIPLLTIAVLLSVSHHGGNFTANGGFAPFGAHGVLAALPLGVVFAMQGFEQALQVGGEARNPQKDMARAVLLSMVIGTVLYLLLEVAFIGSLDPTKLAHGWANPLGKNADAPYATIASGLGLSWLAALLYVDAFVSPSGTGLVYTGTSSRLAYALGRSNYVPPILSKVSKRGVPIVAIVVSFVIGEVALLPFPSWAGLVSVITSASALMYAFAPVSLMALRKQDPDRERPYRLPAPWLICPLSFIAADLIIYWTGWTILWKLFIALGIGVALFVVNLIVSKADQRPDFRSWTSSLWVLPWLAGMGVIDKLGQFKGGDNTIPFWWDIGVVAVFSLVIFYLAVASARPADQAIEAVESELDDEPGEKDALPA